MRNTPRIIGWGTLLMASVITGATCNQGGDSTGDVSGGNGIVDGMIHLVEVPDPLFGDNPRYLLSAADPPEPGQSVTDSAFGIRQMRVVRTEGLRHEYSRLDPFNSDLTRILLLHVSAGEWRVYRADGVPDAGLVRTVNVAEPRWDPNDANLLWGIRDFQILTINVQTGDETVVKDFAQDPTIAPILSANPDLYRITMKDEGESSTDKRYWAFMLQGTAQDYRPRYLRLLYDAASPLALNSGIHISCNAPGWCVVSTFTEPNRPEQNWLDRTITLVRLSRSHPRVFYLAKVHGSAGAYWEETQASITHDGSRVIWSTNWNQHVGQERVWLMELAIPAEAMASIGG